MADKKTDAQQQVDEYKQEINDLRNQLSELATEFKQSSKQNVKQGLDEAQSTYEDVKSGVEKQARKICSQADETTVTAACVSLGIGALIGYLLGRK